MAENRVNRELILEEWNRYYGGAYPEPIPAEAAEHLKAAFFAGAMAYGLVLTRNMDAGVEVAEADLDVLEEVRQELKAFVMRG